MAPLTVIFIIGMLEKPRMELNLTMFGLITGNWFLHSRLESLTNHASQL